MRCERQVSQEERGSGVTLLFCDKDTQMKSLDWQTAYFIQCKNTQLLPTLKMFILVQRTQCQVKFSSTGIHAKRQNNSEFGSEKLAVFFFSFFFFLCRVINTNKAESLWAFCFCHFLPKKHRLPTVSHKDNITTDLIQQFKSCPPCGPLSYHCSTETKT